MPLGRRIEGLALRPNGTFYGSMDNELWLIDPASSAVQKVGEHGYPDVDGLEYAVGEWEYVGQRIAPDGSAGEVSEGRQTATWLVPGRIVHWTPPPRRVLSR